MRKTASASGAHVRARGAQTTEQRLAVVRESGIPFALVFSLTSTSLADLEWAAEFATAQGAAMLQVRPSGELTDEQMATAWMMVECLSDLQRGKLVIHLDSVNRYSLPTEPGDLASWKQDLEREARYLGEIVSPLVIEDDGTVSPLRYGFPRRFAFGNLKNEALAQNDRAVDRNPGRTRSAKSMAPCSTRRGPPTACLAICIRCYRSKRRTPSAACRPWVRAPCRQLELRILFET